MEPMKIAKRIEYYFENFLWSSRFIAIIAVLASLVASGIMFYVATADCLMLLREVVHYGSLTMGSPMQRSFHSEILTTIAEIVDGYLFATILMIFSFGLYEIFISKIDPAEKSDLATGVLFIQTIDDLKARLGKVIFLILVIRYFEWALKSQINTSLDLLYLALGLLLVAVALYVTGKHES